MRGRPGAAGDDAMDGRCGGGDVDARAGGGGGGTAAGGGGDGGGDANWMSACAAGITGA